jgi:hypothetical protein
MPIQVKCIDCFSELKFPDDKAGREVQCPRCDAVFTTPASRASTATESDRRPAPSREEGVQTKRPSKSVRVTQTDIVRKSAPVPEERVTASRPAKDAVTRAEDRLESMPLDEVIPDTESDAPGDGQDAPRKKKRKKKRKAEPASMIWLWWAGSAGVGIVCICAMLLVVMLGMKQEARGYLIALVIMLPVSTAILVLSMFVASAVGGGIEFGEARVAIPKAAALLFVVNMIYVSSCGAMGYVFALPVWLVGLMTLFRLDLWESRLLVSINWILNSVVCWALLSALGVSPGFMPLKHKVEVATAKDEDFLNDVGGQMTYGPGADHPVVAMRLNGISVKDYPMYMVIRFRDCKSLDVSGSCVTDAGLQIISDNMDQLKELVIVNILSTPFGVAKVRQAHPDLKIVDK